ncbi:hypothetical protein E1301_Tti008824 [Triplophysa tibetana]|uniref:Uncharacterized protein n=1 Tax=Triplophysa tibetana TaxID=1572043 RepID=A0A5A9P0L6_9TELE|nr:hypothetical protein E1301_Tti008824 [Triplophysa tibetana]
MGYAEGRAGLCVSLILTLGFSHTQRLHPGRGEDGKMEDTASINTLPFPGCLSLECVLSERSVQSAVRESVWSKILTHQRPEARTSKVGQTHSALFWLSGALKSFGYQPSVSRYLQPSVKSPQSAWAAHNDYVCG